MKPTVQTNSDQRCARYDSTPLRNRRSFPATDYFFQAPMEASTEMSTVRQKSISAMRMFRKLSSESLAETARYYAVELMLFAIITAVSAWALGWMAAALAELGQ